MIYCYLIMSDTKLQQVQKQIYVEQNKTKQLFHQHLRLRKLNILLAY